MNMIKVRGAILTVALATGCLFDVLFWGKMPGLSVLLFVATLLLALVTLGHAADVKPARRNLWIMLPIIFFAGMVAVRSNGLLIALDVLACVVLLALLAYFYAAGRIDRVSILGYSFSFMVTAVNAAFRAGRLARATAAPHAAGGASTQSLRRMLPVLRGLLIALPVAIIFIVLLASADKVFAHYVTLLWNLDFITDLDVVLWQVALALTVGWIVAGALVFALTRVDTGEEELWDVVTNNLPKVIHIGFIEGATVLAVVDLIFLFFGWIQLSYLFGGNANISVEGYTYAEYARQGFFELLAVSVLTMILIVGLQWLTWREVFRQTLAFRVMSTIMVVLTLLLLASAFYRMSLYEEVYGYTHLRLYVHTFEVWLALLFGWLVVALWVQPRKFALGCFVAALGFLATLNLSNPDDVIAQQNLARYRAIGKIDMYYLSDLSEDATITLLANIDTLQGSDRLWLLSALKAKLQAMKAKQSWQELPSFNMARWQAYEALVREETRLAESADVGYSKLATRETGLMDNEPGSSSR